MLENYENEISNKNLETTSKSVVSLRKNIGNLSVSACVAKRREKQRKNKQTGNILGAEERTPVGNHINRMVPKFIISVTHFETYKNNVFRKPI